MRLIYLILNISTWSMHEPKPGSLNGSISIEDNVLTVLLSADTIFLAANRIDFNLHEFLNLDSVWILIDISSIAIDCPHCFRISELIECCNPRIHWRLDGRI